MFPARTIIITAFALAAGLAPAGAQAKTGTRPRPESARPGMVIVPAGTYLPLYGRTDRRVQVGTFALDVEPVTRADYLEFVRANPQWRRGAVKPVWSEKEYLASWPGALDAGEGAELLRPVTEVSWFAAKAYCQAQGKRLPTVSEWEYAAAASETHRDGSGDRAFRQKLTGLYAAREAGLPDPLVTERANAFGVRHLHGNQWEWIADFNSVLISSDSRKVGQGGKEGDVNAFCAKAAVGALDPTNFPAFMRFAFRAGLTGRTVTQGLGFRCASNV
jgi:formylglycine-generating enzyme required for sulfatase activity